MKILKYIGYGAFALFSFVVCLYLTFPWDVAKDLALAEASKALGAKITADKLEPSWVTGVIAEGVKIELANSEEPIELTELYARAKLIPMITGGAGASLELPIAKGRVEADVVDDKESTEIKAHLEGIELALVPGLAEAAGLPLSGIIEADIDLTLSKKNVQESTGKIDLVVKGLELLKGGKVSGFPVPELAIGDLDWSIPVRKGKLILDKQKLQGENVELMLDGDVALNKDFARSVLNLVVSFKPTDAFLKKEPLLGALLSNINRAKGPDGFYSYAMTGSVKHPRFFPKRGGTKR